MRHPQGSHARSAAGFLVVALLLIATLAAGGTALAESPSPAADDTTTLRIGWLTEPDNLNPFVGIQGSSYMIWKMNYDLLVGFDDKTLDPRPELATEWEVSDDGREWTFTIREGATWQDGEPVTANDVAFTLDYIRENELLNLATYTDGILDAEAVDDTTVKITTDGPKANMLRMLVPILPEHVWSNVSGEDAGGQYQNEPPIVGSGPFQVVEWVRGKYMRLEANQDYWGGAPKVDEVIFQLYKNPDTMASDLELGTIDGAIDIPVARFAGLENVPGIETNEATSWSFIEIAMNCYDSPDSKGNPVLLDQTFREAVNWAVDREKVVEVAFQGYGTPGSTIIPPYTQYHWEPAAESAFTYDPAKAEQLLEDAGYKDVDGDGFRETKDGEKLTLRFYATTDSVMNQTAGKLITGWLEDVGIRLKFQVVDAGTLINYQYEYTGDTYTPNWDMFIWYWTQDVDPNFIVDIFTPQQIEGWNDCLWTDEAYTALNEQQKRTIDPGERIPLIQEMQEIFYNGAAYAIVCYPYLLEAYDTDKWQGWVHVPGEAISEQSGAALYSFNNIDTYRFVEPKTAEEESGEGNGALMAGIVIAAIVVIVIVVLLLRRGRQRAETT
jgi:peptide/nickel transport system substrate-binding protein